MALDRSSIVVPELPKTTLECPLLGGEVVVRALLLSEQLANTARQQEERAPRLDESAAEAQARANGTMTVRLLAQVVVDAQGQPLLSTTEWEAFAAKDPSAFFDFASAVTRFSLGAGDDLRKN